MDPHAGWERRWAPAVLGLAALVTGLEWAFGPARSAARPATFWSDAPPPVPRPGTAPPLVIAQAGTDAALKWIFSNHGGRAVRAVERARDAVVRIHVTGMRPGCDERSFVDGSGVLVDGGRHVLTAGHVLEVILKMTDVRASVSMADGRARRVRLPGIRGGVDGAPQGDWGLLELEDPPPERCPSLPMRTAVKGAHVAILGFPSPLGVDFHRRVVRHDHGEGLALRPLVVTGVVRHGEFGTVDPAAGAQLEGGASGGAIIDLEGNLVGVYTAVIEVRIVVTPISGTDGPPEPTGEPTLGDARTCFGGTPVAVFREFVEARWKR